MEGVGVVMGLSKESCLVPNKVIFLDLFIFIIFEISVSFFCFF